MGWACSSISRNSSFGKATGYGLDDRMVGVRFPAEAGYFSLRHHVQTGSGTHPASYPMDIGWLGWWNEGGWFGLNTYEGVSKSFRTDSITKYTLIFGITCWEATQMVMAAKLTSLTHKIATQLHPVAESCIICSSPSRRPVWKLLDTPSYVMCNVYHLEVTLSKTNTHLQFFGRGFRFKQLLLYCSLGVKRLERDADHSPQSSAKVTNVWSYTYTPQYVFMTWCLVKHRNNFTFTFTVLYSFKIHIYTCLCLTMWQDSEQSTEENIRIYEKWSDSEIEEIIYWRSS
jgi:hypothetical protein